MPALRAPWLAVLLAAAALTGPTAARADRESRRTPVVRAIEQVQDAVVSISTDELVRVRVGGGDWYDQFFRGYVEPPRYREGYRQVALGSGALLDASGYVVTNYHVVRRGARIRVHLRDGRELVAKVVGTDPDSDLAVLKVEAGGPLPALPLAPAGDVMLGETVIAIGNPFGLSHTVSTGIISALHRNLDAGERTYFDFLQTDASINPGNSGGPLLDLDGQVVGINTAVYGQGQNIGFAIPAGRVHRVVADLIAHGRVREPWLGLVVGPRDEGQPGVAVQDVLRDSPAERRVRRGDVLLSLDDRPVDGPDEYRYRLRDVPVGGRVRLRLLRDGKELSVALQAAEAPAGLAEEILARYVGVEVADIDARLARAWRLPARRGVVVTKVLPGSAAEQVGLRPGDVVRAANAVEVTARKDLTELILRAERSGELVLIVQRGRRLHELVFPLSA